MLNDEVKGKGYGSEAVRLVLNYLFNVLNLEAVVADTVLRNTRSQHVLQKCGLQYTHEDDVFKYYMIKATAHSSGL